MKQVNILGCVSDKYQFIILLIPKNASSTIREESRNSIFQGEEILSANWTKTQKEQFKKYAFLRDPMERFLSGYKEVYNRFIGLDQYHKAKRIVAKNPLDFLSPFDSTESVYEFLEHIRKRGFFNKHIKPQTILLKEFNIDQYFLVERINEGFNQIRLNCGLKKRKGKLPQHRQQRNLPKRKSFIHFQNELPNDLLASIKELYKDDFELYQKVTRSYAIL